jgi:tetratricopeptide (TPR) repeat protein
MFNSTEVPQLKLILALCLLSAACGSAHAALREYSRPSSQTQNSQAPVEQPPARALRILGVDEGMPSQTAGLQPMDLLSRYGEFEIVDNASYFAAREFYEKSPDVRVRIVVWRNRQRLTATVPPGRLGIETNEYNPVSYKFDSLMENVNSLLEIPEYMRDHEFKESFAVPPEKTLEEARSLIDRAEQESSITPAQVLVARIYMILDDAPPEEIKTQAELLKKLCSTNPDSYVIFLGEKLFLAKKRYRAAIECYKQHLKVYPDDVSVRLNLGFAYYHLRMSDEADAAADYVLDKHLGLSDLGFRIACQIKAMAALGHHDYAKSISFAEKSFATTPASFDISLIELAAAQNGDLQKVEDAARTFQELLPEKYERLRMQVDAVLAYALVKNNLRDAARQVILKWKDMDRIEGRLNEYWRVYPGGSDVVQNWKELARD